jgi:probable selenium-dependent hydroxylase accessory protein YqeC
MIQGTMSGAGKSILTAGILRVLRQDGYRVAPFKSQNMALNSYVTREGLEMGRAQVVQAAAAGMEPSADMNPILPKPMGDTTSQVIVNGRPIGKMRAADYYKVKKSLVPDILAAYERLRERADIIVIEADGAHRRPLKFPGDNEPVILDETDIVIAVSGLDALGKMAGEVCHRMPEAEKLLNLMWWQTLPAPGKLHTKRKLP